MSNGAIDSRSNILWIDSNSNVITNCQLLREHNYRVAYFQETMDALEALHKGKLDIRNIQCVITSMMERGGRKERGCLNGLQMLDQIRNMSESNHIRKPLFAVISATADDKECTKHGVDIIVHTDWRTVQVRVIDALKKIHGDVSQNRVILIGISGPSGCGKTTYAKHLAKRFRSPLVPVSLDFYFKKPIMIDHHVLGHIKSLEDPVTIKSDEFLETLQNIRKDWKNVRIPRSNYEYNGNHPIVVVVEGFLLFALSDDITSMFDFRIFLDSTLERCRLQRYRRDRKIPREKRDSDIVISQDFELWYTHLVWSEYLKRSQQQMARAERVFVFNDPTEKAYEEIDAYIDGKIVGHGNDYYEEINRLADELDLIDRRYGNTAKSPSDPLYSQRVREKALIRERIQMVLPALDDEFPLEKHLLSSSYAHQTLAVQWISYKKNTIYTNLLCYILLNSSSDFLRYNILETFENISDQCDYAQMQQIRSTLLQYNAPQNTGQKSKKAGLIKNLETLSEFSISSILPKSHLWHDTESKFFNSLSGIIKYRITNIQIIRNKRLSESFNNCRLRFLKKDNTLFVYHGSSPESLRAIAKDGFLEPKNDTKAGKAPKSLDQGYFGRGIYHGFAADYAIHYSKSYRNSNEILLSMVLPGQSYRVSKGGESFGKDCRPGYDSHISPERKEIVLFRSEQILPLFIIEFSEAPCTKITEEGL